MRVLDKHYKHKTKCFYYIASHKMRKEYRELLSRIAREIKPEELEIMKFLCADFMPYIASQTERNGSCLREVFEFFYKLEKRVKLGIDDLDLLKDMLTHIQREQLLMMVIEFQIQRQDYLSFLNVNQRAGDRNRTTRSEQDGNEEEGQFRENQRIESTQENREEEITPENQTSKGILTVRCIPYVAGMVWMAGSLYILNLYKRDPQALANMVAKVVVPTGTLIRTIFPGSIKLLLQVTDLSSLRELWKRYKRCQLKEDLERVFLTKELRQLADGEKIELIVEISEKEYRNVCLDLMIAQTKVKFQRPLLSTTSDTTARQISRSLPDLTSLDTPRNLSRDVVVMAEPPSWSVFRSREVNDSAATRRKKPKPKLPDDSMQETKANEISIEKDASNVLPPATVLSFLTHFETIQQAIEWLMYFFGHRNPHRDERLSHLLFFDCGLSIAGYLAEFTHALQNENDFLKEHQVLLHPEKLVNDLGWLTLRLRKVDADVETKWPGIESELQGIPRSYSHLTQGKTRRALLLEYPRVDKKEMKENITFLVKKVEELSALLVEEFKFDEKLLEEKEESPAEEHEHEELKGWRVEELLQEKVEFQKFGAYPNEHTFDDEIESEEENLHMSDLD